MVSVGEQKKPGCRVGNRAFDRFHRGGDVV